MKKIKQRQTRKIAETIDAAQRYQRAGYLDQAQELYRKALKEQPGNVQIHLGLSSILRTKGLLHEAITHYRKALALDPNQADVYSDLGSALQAEGRIDEAITYYQKALDLSPVHAIAHYNLGSAYQQEGRLEDAIAHYRKAVAYQPSAVFYNNLATALTQKGQIDEAVGHYRNALQLNPNYDNAYYNLGTALREQGNPEEAIAAFDKCLSVNPRNTPARWARCISHLPIVYPDSASIHGCREQYSHELTNLTKTIGLKDPRDIEAAASAVGSLQPFYLAYQGLNDRDLQRVYGDLVCRIMAAGYPRLARALPMPAGPAGEPLRVGIVSGHFYLHPVWKIIAKGWTENLDRNKIRLYGYYTGKRKDNETETAKQGFSRFVERAHSFEDLCNAITADNLHVLIYPEIGMDSTTVKLAALRLAPVQCASWGHPDTSGLPTIDYYLSGELMEPPDGEAAYTERLVRLPNLSVYYTPDEVVAAEADRDTFGLRSGAVLYHCCQTLFKFLPQYDELFPRIAREVGDCRFLFSSLPGSSTVRELFRSRMDQAFDRLNLKAADYVVFMPYLDAAAYKAFNNMCDVFLDPIGWSGCTSTLEAIDCHLPVVAFPGPFMRGRESGAILSMMGITETIAGSLDEYIALAVRLGRDRQWRRGISDRIAENKHRVYGDRECIAGLEDFVERVVKEKLEAASK